MNIAIIGLGLIGGSIGIKLKLQNSNFKIIGVPRREETIQAAIDRGAIDKGTTDLKAGVKDADLVFICTPINLVIPILEEIVPHLKKGAIVTDVASTKELIVSRAEAIMPKGAHFLGGHPMAGKEKVKLEAADADLFKGATWILTPTKKTKRQILKTVAELVILLGGKVMKMEPKLHDLVVAGVSHMPLAVAAALVNTVAETKQGQEEMKQTAASGFRDTTRIASGDPVLGVDMFTTNKDAVLKMISSFKDSLSKLEDVIKEGNAEKIKKELETAKRFRDSVYRD